MKTLVIVDLQKDFYAKNGALYVKGAEVLPSRIAKRIKEGDFDNIIITMDNHPLNHCSFIENGGQWPMHCVKGTEGASVSEKIFDAIKELNAIRYVNGNSKPNVVIVDKGCESNKEEYGAFANYKKYNNIFRYLLSNSNDIDVYNLLRESEDIEVCGIALDYCVMHTVKELISFVESDKVWVNTKCSKSIDDGTTFKKFAEENNIFHIDM